MKILSRLALIGLFGAWFVLLRPPALGGPASYEVVSGTSMEPTLHAGDLVIAHRQASFAIGDVVVYRVPATQPGSGALIVHRIVGGDAASGFVMQGDNKTTPDPWRPTATDVVGRSWVEVPAIGRLFLVLRTPLVLATVLGGLVGFSFLTSGQGDPSNTKRGLADGPRRWIRRPGRHQSEVADSSRNPVASLTPIRDMRERNAQMLARR